MKRLVVLLPILLFLGIAVAFAYGLTRDPSKIPSTLIDKPLPAFALPGVAPETPGLASAELKGQPALLNVFASWCLPCRAEHPVLLGLADQGVPIYGIDWKEPPADGAKWLGELGNPYARVGNDASGRTGIDLGVTGVPETFVLDAQGRVRYKHIGPIDREAWEETLKPLLEKLARDA